MTRSRRGASEDRSLKLAAGSAPTADVAEGRRKDTMTKANQEQAGRRERRQFDETYKRNAVALTLQAGRSVKAVAEELGVTDSLLYEWRRVYAPRPSMPTSAPASLEDANREIARLRAEVVRLRERETILKKSLGILSEPPGSGMPGSMR